MSAMQNDDAAGFSDGVEKRARAAVQSPEREDDDDAELDRRLAALRRYHRAEMDDQLVRRSDMWKRTPPEVTLTALAFAQEEASLRDAILRQKGADPAVADIRRFAPQIDGRKVFFISETGSRAFQDDGKRIDMLVADDDLALLAALQLAEQRWGVVRVHGAEEFEDRVVRLAAEHDVQLANADLALRVAQLRISQGHFTAPDEVAIAPQIAAVAKPAMPTPAGKPADRTARPSASVTPLKPRTPKAASAIPADEVVIEDDKRSATAPEPATTQAEAQATRDDAPSKIERGGASEWITRLRAEQAARNAARGAAPDPDMPEEPIEFDLPEHEPEPDLGIEGDDDFGVATVSTSAAVHADQKRGSTPNVAPR